jgi:hypothetical protein
MTKVESNTNVEALLRKLHSQKVLSADALGTYLMKLKPDGMLPGSAIEGLIDTMLDKTAGLSGESKETLVTLTRGNHPSPQNMPQAIAAWAR